MTRTDDTFVPLMARPALIKPNHAQYFISIHCAYCWPANSASGVEVYYHGQNDRDKLFAEDNLNSVQRISAMPAYGVRSDISRFPTGFGVLRASPVPAVLVECGSLNNAKDVAMLRQPQTQQQIADAIAAGVDAFKPATKIR